MPNYSKTRAKKLSDKIDKETLTNFREELSNLIISKDENTVILYEDEAIVTSKPSPTAVWIKIGVQHIVKINLNNSGLNMFIIRIYTN